MARVATAPANLATEISNEDQLGEVNSGATPSMVELAYTDSLTGLANRRRLEDTIERLIAERADDPAPFAIGILDLDGFKPINDLFGHAAGDTILKQIAQRLSSCLPKGGLAARLGGDEFAFVLPYTFTESDAYDVGDAVRDVLSAPYDLGERFVRLSGSFGFAIHPFGGDTYSDIMGSADTALYRSKKRGRNQITIYSNAVADEMKRATQIEQALRQAITSGDVKPHFQPIVDITTGCVIGFEALARWTDKELGFVPPDVFIPLAEERGFVALLSDSLLKQAATAALSWQDELFLSFNLSSMQLMDPTTADSVLNIINSVGLPPERLELEITETAIMGDPEMAFEIVEKLRAEGVRLSLDDFGTGQSSLGRLRDFNFDKVKIDRSFISSIEDDRPSEHIIRAIIAMCAGLDLKVIAEGIEDDGQEKMLLELGCQSGQGYLYSKAMDTHTTLRFLKDLK